MVVHVRLYALLCSLLLALANSLRVRGRSSPGGLSQYTSTLLNLRPAFPTHHYHDNNIHYNNNKRQSRLQASSQNSFSDGRGAFGAMYIRPDEYKLNEVVIEVPSMNSRKITASTIVDAPMGNIWGIITDYNNLAEHVPNLVKSYVVPGPSGRGSSQYNVRLFQEGAQKIIGFDFRASLTMDMTEDVALDSSTERLLSFKLVESTMFASFDGIWSMRSHSCYNVADPITKQPVRRERSLLTYSVYVKPKGIVPVLALEWRIKEDIPINLQAVKIAAEAFKPPLLRQSSGFSLKGLALGASSVDWQADETLASYLSAKVPTK